MRDSRIDELEQAYEEAQRKAAFSQGELHCKLDEQSVAMSAMAREHEQLKKALDESKQQMTEMAKAVADYQGMTAMFSTMMQRCAELEAERKRREDAEAEAKRLAEEHAKEAARLAELEAARKAEEEAATERAKALIAAAEAAEREAAEREASERAEAEEKRKAAAVVPRSRPLATPASARVAPPPPRAKDGCIIS